MKTVKLYRVFKGRFFSFANSKSKKVYEVTDLKRLNGRLTVFYVCIQTGEIYNSTKLNSDVLLH